MARWIESLRRDGYCVQELDALGPSILQKLEGCQAFLWHLDQDRPAELEYARSILYSAELRGLRVYPNHATCWHFDDKVAQKYLLEASGAPLAPTWVFFSRESALEFLAGAELPLVFKLRRGAGSLNVQLVSDRAAGRGLIARMFGGGLRSQPPVERLRRAIERARKKRPSPFSWRTRAVRVARRWLAQTLRPNRERNYVIFQRFVPGNDHDLRVTIIGDRAFTYRRDVRPNDFRASGSGRLRHLTEAELPRDAIAIAFGLSRRLGFQSMAYDFVRDPITQQALLLEISYVFVAQYIHDCLGYLRFDGTWQEGHFWPEDAILEDLLNSGDGSVGRALQRTAASR